MYVAGLLTGVPAGLCLHRIQFCECDGETSEDGRHRGQSPVLNPGHCVPMTSLRHLTGDPSLTPGNRGGLHSARPDGPSVLEQSSQGDEPMAL